MNCQEIHVSELLNENYMDERLTSEEKKIVINSI